MRTPFFVADPHFDHERIMRYCKRPFKTIEEMNETLIQNWNAAVKRGNTVYILGDFAFKNHMTHFHRLNGKKILIRGNHDHMNQEILRNFTEVHDLLTRRFNRHFVTMCHYPMRSWDRSFHGSYHLFGHVHGRLSEHPSMLCLDVGVDVPQWGFTPISWDVLEEYFKKKKEKWKEFWESRNKEQKL